ncbi:MAG: Ig-like domain-containing protein [Lachnospiraceae bacterium]|nr:Ig-like domain-containing protein [Lachnospiraceae bacterium]
MASIKGGSWQSIGDKLHLYIQIPEMQKKAEAKMDDKNLSAFTFLSKTSYSPTKWTSSNENVAKVDENGNITIIKKGKTNIIAEYGEGKSGSKKKFKTKLKIS